MKAKRTKASAPAKTSPAPRRRAKTTPSSPSPKAVNPGNTAVEQTPATISSTFDSGLIYEEAKELIQRLECAFFTGADSISILRLHELAVLATTTLHDCWHKHETIPHHKWSHEVNGLTFLPREFRRELMRLACTDTPFPVLHFWPQSKASFSTLHDKDSQLKMLEDLSHERLKKPGKIDNIVAPLIAEVLNDLNQHFINLCFDARKAPVESLEYRAWEVRARGIPKTRDEISMWARLAADWLIDKAQRYDELRASKALPKRIIQPAKNCGRLKPRGDLYEIANPLKFAEKARQKRWATYKRLLLKYPLPDKVSDYSVEDYNRKVWLNRKHRDASKPSVTDAHIREGLTEALTRYLETKTSPAKD